MLADPGGLRARYDDASGRAEEARHPRHSVTQPDMRSHFLKVFSFTGPLLVSLALATPAAAQIDDLLFTLDPADPTPGDITHFNLDNGTPGDYAGLLLSTAPGRTDFPLIGLMELGVENLDLYNLGQFDQDGHAAFVCGQTCNVVGLTFYMQGFSLRIGPPVVLAGKSNPIALFVSPDHLEDCNNNGIDDDCDILDGTSQDCNQNNVPDECEPDCNLNDVPDDCDIADGTSTDLNGNGIPDECEPDCNLNGIPDELDIADGTSLDCDANGVPDECQPDCDQDGIPDVCEADCDQDGIPDDCANEPDCNGNDVPDSCDIADGTSNDVNANGVPDECEPDCNANGIPDSYDISTGSSQDCDANGVPDECQPDCDNDGIPDACEPDCDQDGIPDDCANEPDCNGNDVPDSCDIANGTSLDVNANGVPDECEPDCDGNGVPDSYDIATGNSPDCDGNGVPDVCQPDCDQDGIPDACEPDCDEDGIPDDCEGDCNLNGIPDDCEDCGDTVGLVWDFEACLAFDDASSFAEFTAVQNGGCANVTVVATKLDQPGGGHSCTYDALNNDPGDAACVMADDDSYWDFNDNDNTIKWRVTVNETQGELASLKDFCFWHQAPDDFSQSDADGFSVTHQNNPPALYGLRIKRDGVQVFFQKDIPTSSSWTKTTFDFSGPDFAVSNGSARFDFELLAYAPVWMGGSHGSIWDLDQFEATVCCKPGAPGDCDLDGIPDFCEEDCNQNGIPDDCDILDGTSQDQDGSGVPDECECTPPAWPKEPGTWELSGTIYIKKFSSWNRTYTIQCMTATYDGQGNLRIVGTASNSSHTVAIDFTYTVSLDGSNLKSYDGSNDFGTITNLSTGQSVQLRGDDDDNDYAGRLKSTSSGHANLKGWLEDQWGNSVGDFDNAAWSTCDPCN